MRKKEKVMKVIVTMLVIMFGLVMCFGNKTYAAPISGSDSVESDLTEEQINRNNQSASNTQVSGKGVSGIIRAGKGWMQTGKNANKSNTSVESFVNELIDIGQILVIIGGATVLIAAAIMAVKWITATPDKQAKLKTQLIGLVLATVVIFGAVGIWTLVRNVMGQVESKIENSKIEYKTVQYING